MRLSTFIRQYRESILQDWEDFARSLLPASSGTDTEDLRDHAAQMLDVIAADLDTPQSNAEQHQKSLGRAPIQHGESYAETHASARLLAGYTINQLVSEYRALRASVLKLWSAECRTSSSTDANDVMRFNEAIDQALAESVSRFSQMTSERLDNDRRRWDAVLEAAPVGICVVDRTGRILLANAEHKRIWGEYPMSESVDEYGEWKAWWKDGSERQGTRVAAHEWTAARALAGEEAPKDTLEIEPFGAPGVRKTVLFCSTPIRDSNGAIAGSVLAQTDISAQVRTEAALRESEAQFRTIANAMPQMVWSTRPDGFHDYFNQQWYEFTGMAMHATDGDGWNAMFHPDDRERAWSAWRQSLATGETYEIQYRLRHHTGEYRWTLGRALPVRDELGRIIRWMGTCTDIHGQKLAEEELQKQSQRKDEFLAMLAHELRNPLAPISTAAHLLKLQSDDPKRVQQAGEVVARQVKHMTDLVNDLLDVSRVTRGLVQLDRARVDLKSVVAHAIEQVRPLIESRRHDLKVHMAPGAATVLGDKTRLVQVVANVLSNAAKYTPQGGHIGVVLEIHRGTVSIQVSDDGSGIAPTLLPYVFNLFAQGERTPDRSQGGLGLGLSLVRQITALHGGNATAESEGLGKGARFTVALPCAPKQEGSTEEPTPIENQSIETIDIMIVDDNVDAARSLADLLRSAGHRAVVMEDAHSALSSMSKDHTHLFVLDIGLPGMDGYELARDLRRDPATADAVLVALTGYGQAHDRVLSKAAGFDHHLVKPVDMSQLERIIMSIAAHPGSSSGESQRGAHPPEHRHH